jgi:predicted dehydrogenase
MLVNAGEIPKDHWTQDRDIGGGRIIGEVCHFIDLLSFISGGLVNSVYATSIAHSHDGITHDKVSLQLQFSDGSIGTVHYFANGNKKFPKERLEVFSEGRILVLDNFKELLGFGFPKFSNLKLRAQDKGHEAEIESFVSAIKQGLPTPISWEEIKNVTLASFAAHRSLGSEAVEYVGKKQG